MRTYTARKGNNTFEKLLLLKEHWKSRLLRLFS